MSQTLIQHYLNQLADLRTVSGTSREMVLLQSKQVVMRAAVDDVAALEFLLALFFKYERPEIGRFRKAVDQFKADLPAVLESLHAMIAQASGENPAFRAAAKRFLTHAQETINPSLTEADVREMLIQYVLTYATSVTTELPLQFPRPRSACHR